MKKNHKQQIQFLGYYFKKKKNLIPVNYELLDSYYSTLRQYKVSNESMITYHGIKYSVPIQYVGKQLTVIDNDNVIYIYYNSNLGNLYQKYTNIRYNYKKDYIDIVVIIKKQKIKLKNTYQKIPRFL